MTIKQAIFSLFIFLSSPIWAANAYFEPAQEKDRTFLIDFAITSNDIYQTRTASRETAYEVFNIPQSTFDHGIVEVLRVDGEIVGFFTLHPHEKQSVYELSHLFVKPGLQHHGYGTTLFKRAVEQVRARGGKRIEWLCDPDAKVFYLKMGAQIIGYTDNLLNPGVDLPIFAYDL